MEYLQGHREGLETSDKCTEDAAAALLARLRQHSPSKMSAFSWAWRRNKRTVGCGVATCATLKPPESLPGRKHGGRKWEEA
eukprot:366320-Chlamydomonas_euryale.AAC.1